MAGRRTYEARRLALQDELDAQKTSRERNALGQFATPTDLARGIVREAASLLPRGEPINFLDPGIGTGSFYSALKMLFPQSALRRPQGLKSTRITGFRPRNSGLGPNLVCDLKISLRLGHLGLNRTVTISLFAIRPTYGTTTLSTGKKSGCKTRLKRLAVSG